MLVKKQDGDTRFQEYDLDTVEVESIISTSGGWTEFAKLEIKRKGNCFQTWCLFTEKEREWDASNVVNVLGQVLRFLSPCK